MKPETGIPIPAPTRGGAAKNQYPFNKLNVGESVLYPCTDQKERAKARKAAYQRAAYLGWRITVRSLTEGVRVWRHE